MTTGPAIAGGGSAAGRTAVTNVRVFDGWQLSGPCTVVIDGAVIGTDATGAQVIDGAEAVLLPGLIDAHLHLHGRESLERLCSAGVTTGLDMACWPPELVASLREVPELTDIRSAGIAAIGAGVPLPPDADIPPDAIVGHPDQAQRFVTNRVSEGSDYIKIMAEAPGAGGPDQATMDALVTAAHRHNRKVVVHALTTGAYAMALDAGADMITHIPLGQNLDPAEVARMAAQQQIAIPTLTIMEGLAAARGTPEAFTAARRSVTALHEAGVPILAGTDANAFPGVPVQVPHGESIHHELELLVDCGLTPAEALRSATCLPAHHFGLTDRGAIEPGLRADLVLIDGDPLADIRATRNIARIWCAGTEHTPSPTDPRSVARRRS